LPSSPWQAMQRDEKRGLTLRAKSLSPSVDSAAK